MQLLCATFRFGGLVGSPKSAIKRHGSLRIASCRRESMASGLLRDRSRPGDRHARGLSRPTHEEGTAETLQNSSRTTLLFNNCDNKTVELEY